MVNVSSLRNRCALTLALMTVSLSVMSFPARATRSSGLIAAKVGTPVMLVGMTDLFAQWWAQLFRGGLGGGGSSTGGDSGNSGDSGTSGGSSKKSGGSGGSGGG